MVQWRVVDCGPPVLRGRVLATAGDFCGQVRNTCAVDSLAALPTDPTITTEATLRRTPGHAWTVAETRCAVSTGTARLSPLTARQAIIRRVPHPTIGIAPPGGTTLVNIQTLLWVDSATDRTLPSATLLGHQLDLRVHLAHVDWNFGDGQTAATSSPERAYTPDDPCTTALCPHYWGHIYTTTGSKTITATITWTGEYRIDHGPWQPVPGTVRGPAATTQLTVRQAHTVLVAPPRH